MPNLLHFLPDMDAFYALRHAPNFYEIYQWFILALRALTYSFLYLQVFPAQFFAQLCKNKYTKGCTFEEMLAL
jgi:hypothetical protein